MPEFKMPELTERTYRPYAKAFVDPASTADDVYLSTGPAPHTVQRGEDIELNGELTIFDGPPLFTGVQLGGTYETYWHVGDALFALAILEPGSEPVAGVDAGSYDMIDSGVFCVTTREGVDLLQPRYPLPEHGTYLRGEGTTLVCSGTGFGDGGAGISVLLDASHQPCGYIFGDVLETSFEYRILPRETGRISYRQLVAELSAAPHHKKLEAVTTDGTSLGFATFCDWHTIASAVYLGSIAEGDTVANLAADLANSCDDGYAGHGVEAVVDNSRSVGWIRELDLSTGTPRLVVSQDPLPDWPI